MSAGGNGPSSIEHSRILAPTMDELALLPRVGENLMPVDDKKILRKHIVQDEKLISKILINQRALTQLEKYALHFPLCRHLWRQETFYG